VFVIVFGLGALLSCSQEATIEESSVIVPQTINDLAALNSIMEDSVKVEEAISAIDKTIDSGISLERASLQLVNETLGDDVLALETIRDEGIEPEEAIEDFDAKKFFARFQNSCNLPTYEQLELRVHHLEKMIDSKERRIEGLKTTISLMELEATLFRSQIQMYQLDSWLDLQLSLARPQ
jgi:hypothetical protein